MQTLYYTTYNFIRPTNNVVDLNEYRRKLDRAEAQRNSWCDRSEEEEEPQAVMPRPRRSQQRRERRAAMLDMLASMGMLVMTITVTLYVLCV